MEEFTEQQLSEFRQVFDVFDKDGSGKITKKELKKMLRAVGHNPTDDEIKLIMKQFDTDDSGKIEFKEFLEIMKLRRNIDPDEELRQAFKVFDKNGDGVIDAEELKKVMKTFGKKLSKDEIKAVTYPTIDYLRIR